MPQNGLPVIVHSPVVTGLGQPTWMVHVSPDTWRSDRQTTPQNQKVLWTPGAGRRILFMGFMFSTSAAMNIQIEENGNVLVPPVDLPGNGGANVLFLNGLMLDPDAVLSYTSSGQGAHSVMLYGKEF